LRLDLLPRGWWPGGGEHGRCHGRDDEQRPPSLWGGPTPAGRVARVRRTWTWDTGKVATPAAPLAHPGQQGPATSASRATATAPLREAPPRGRLGGDPGARGPGPPPCPAARAPTGAAITPQATRAPLLPVGSVTSSSGAACTTMALPSASRRLRGPLEIVTASVTALSRPTPASFTTRSGRSPAWAPRGLSRPCWRPSG
jgi:hypothetical protein